MSLFHPVMLFQAVCDSLTAGRADVLTAIGVHLAIALSLLGPLGYGCFAIGLGVAFTLPSVPFHNPAGTDRTGTGKSGGHWRNVLCSTRSLDAHDNWLVRYLMNGADYHIEHHLWEDVPTENLHLLEPMAREYCELHGLEYRSVRWLDGWKESWLEGMRLSALSARAGRISRL